MSGLPEPDRPRLAAKHNSVIPAPHHSINAARYLSDGYQMTRRDPLPPWRREPRCVPDGDNLAPGQDLAGILSGTKHDAAAQSRGNQGARRRSSHSPSMPERICETGRAAQFPGSRGSSTQTSPLAELRPYLMQDSRSYRS
jgi:hypothetical protein